jgi:peptidoglycan/LPS O-acetylase OafA/YrhL
VGILRIILALSVVFYHSGFVVVFVGPGHAVQLFYVISGFLISYILRNTKSYENPITFYSNRILRLYPVYYFVAALSLCAYLFGSQKFVDVYKSIPFGAVALLVISNLCLLGQDWVKFSAIENGHLVFSTDFHNSEIDLQKGLLIDPAWTLGVELSFYIIAPFILHDKRKIYCLLIASLTLRIYLLMNGIGFKDPWINRFFPCELALFLIGALSHQLLLPFWERMTKKSSIKIDKLATLFLVGLSMIYFLIPIREGYKVILLFAIFIPLLPLAFVFQRQHPTDKKIGDLSYPIYIGHFLVVQVVEKFLQYFAITNAGFGVSMKVILSSIFALFLYRYIAKPVEQLRSRIRSSNKYQPRVSDSLNTS